MSLLGVDNRKIAEEWIDAFNQHDLEKLLALYDDNAVHFSPKLKVRFPETNGQVRGKDQLRKWWNDAFERLPTLRYHLNKTLCDDHTIFMEYLRTVEGEQDLMVGEILELQNGLIINSRVYHS